MSEVKGQLLSVLLVLGIFSLVAGVITGVVTSLNKAVTDKSTELIEEIEKTPDPSGAFVPNLLHY